MTFHRVRLRSGIRTIGYDAAGQYETENTYTEYEPASEYDALAARLAEAERAIAAALECVEDNDMHGAQVILGVAPRAADNGTADTGVEWWWNSWRNDGIWSGAIIGTRWADLWPEAQAELETIYREAQYAASPAEKHHGGWNLVERPQDSGPVTTTNGPCPITLTSDSADGGVRHKPPCHVFDVSAYDIKPICNCGAICPTWKDHAWVPYTDSFRGVWRECSKCGTPESHFFGKLAEGQTPEQLVAAVTVDGVHK